MQTILSSKEGIGWLISKGGVFPIFPKRQTFTAFQKIYIIRYRGKNDTFDQYAVHIDFFYLTLAKRIIITYYHMFQVWIWSLFKIISSWQFFMDNALFCIHDWCTCFQDLLVLGSYRNENFKVISRLLWKNYSRN